MLFLCLCCSCSCCVTCFSFQLIVFIPPLPHHPTVYLSCHCFIHYYLIFCLGVLIASLSLFVFFLPYSMPVTSASLLILLFSFSLYLLLLCLLSCCFYLSFFIILLLFIFIHCYYSHLFQFSFFNPFFFLTHILILFSVYFLTELIGLFFIVFRL